ncbi:MAG: type II toxin-antitoxin system RelE/ParE family toxin [Erysipelotrichaceae bacterium]|nr:type II toxin-antitoxin system RelE/ParE family toxin [Erysipelotrichaceae bacterium]
MNGQNRISQSFLRRSKNIYSYFFDTLKNEKAAKDFIDNVETAIINRSYFPKSSEPYISKKKRSFTYYRIYVGHFTIFYIVKDDNEPIMEIHRIIYTPRDISQIL